MYRSRLSLLACLALVALSCASRGGTPAAERHVPLSLGDLTVRAAVVVHEGAGPAYLNVHDNENTAVEAARAVAERRGGRIVHLEHLGARNIRFRLRGAAFGFDPNRIFTDAGARRTLEAEGAATDEAVSVVRAFADSLLALYDFGGQQVVIALHNNTEGAYSALSYRAGGEYARDALRVHLDPERDPDDFFFVTDAALFERLRERGFNVVLQDNDAATDDGSLSVYAGLTGKPYVNVEAQEGHLEEQIEMLLALDRVLRRTE